jgi:hypothetical protein
MAAADKKGHPEAAFLVNRTSWLAFTKNAGFAGRLSLVAYRFTRADAG